MKTNKIFLISALALLACSCSEEEKWGGQPTPGEEVKFGASLESTDTRTIYGDEANGAFPIYWVNGDRVQIFSPQCATNDDPDAIGSAVYAVTVEKATQNYATSIDKVGDWGVRWGDNATADFYSVYPATSATVVGQDCKSARLTMTTQQNNTVKIENGAKKVYPDMNACFMYAVTRDAVNGEDVNLSYKPLSTALRFTVQGPTSGDPVTISYVRLYAPKNENENTYLSGSFNVDFTNADESTMPTVTAVKGKAYNYASMNAAYESGGYITLAAGETVELNLFFLLEQAVEIGDGWYIEVAADNGTYQKNLAPQDLDANRTLQPGQIHRITTPLPALDGTGDWDASNWMTHIQRNVYLSEISIPGSWNSLNPAFQGENPSIDQQYDAGVRAFHLDTRWRATGHLNLGGKITDLGIANGGDTYYDVNVGLINNGYQYMRQDAPTFADALSQITSRVQPDEYMVVYCTFAQGSGQPTDDRNWRTEIANACAQNTNVIDADDLDANSTVADVLGKVIVIVSTMYSDEVPSKAFYVDLRNNLDDTFISTNYFEKVLKYDNIDDSDIKLYATYAQITSENDGHDTGDRGYAPSIAERQQKINNILNWSQGNYNASITGNNFAHDTWIFMGLGGYVFHNGIFGDDEYYDRVNNALIPIINERITSMESNEAYYPVGIVFMNNVNNKMDDDVDITQTANDILQLNNKYRKAYDPNRSPVDGELVGGISVQSAAPGYSSGMTDSHTNAIGW